MICQKLDPSRGLPAVPGAEADQRREVLEAVLAGLRGLPEDREPVVLPVTGFRWVPCPGSPDVGSARGWFEVRLADGSSAGMPSPELLAVLVARVEEQAAAAVGVGR